MYLLKISILFKIYEKTADRGPIIYIGMISSGKLVFELTGSCIGCHFLWFGILAYKRAREFFIIEFRYSMNSRKHYFFLNSSVVFQLLNFSFILKLCKQKGQNSTQNVFSSILMVENFLRNIWFLNQFWFLFIVNPIDSSWNIRVLLCLLGAINLDKTQYQFEQLATYINESVAWIKVEI